MSIYDESETVVVSYKFKDRTRRIELDCHFDDDDEEVIVKAKVLIAKLFGGKLPFGVSNWQIVYRGANIKGD